jgi:hypothetical protein
MLTDKIRNWLAFWCNLDGQPRAPTASHLEQTTSAKADEMLVYGDKDRRARRTKHCCLSVILFDSFFFFFRDEVTVLLV